MSTLATEGEDRERTTNRVAVTRTPTIRTTETKILAPTATIQTLNLTQAIHTIPTQLPLQVPRTIQTQQQGRNNTATLVTSSQQGRRTSNNKEVIIRGTATRETLATEDADADVDAADTTTDRIITTRTTATTTVRPIILREAAVAAAAEMIITMTRGVIMGTCPKREGSLMTCIDSSYPLELSELSSVKAVKRLKVSSLWFQIARFLFTHRAPIIRRYHIMRLTEL